MWVIVREPWRVKSLFLRGTIEKKDTWMGDGCCLLWQWCNSWRIQRSRTNRSKRCGLRFLCTQQGMRCCHRERQGRSDASRWSVDASVRVLCVSETLTSLPAMTLSHTSSPQLVHLATPFTPVVVGAPKPLKDVTAGPMTRVSKSPVPLSVGTPLEEPFTSKPLLRSSILCESRRYWLCPCSTHLPRALITPKGRHYIVNNGT